MNGNGTIKVTAGLIYDAELKTERMVLEVADTGSGMSSETLSRVFDPFFTTKGVGEGTGLGLSTVLGIVKKHSGTIRINSAPGEGTVVRISLPVLTNS
jgi:signal transduction histidine kinase